MKYVKLFESHNDIDMEEFFSFAKEAFVDFMDDDMVEWFVGKDNTKTLSKRIGYDRYVRYNPEITIRIKLPVDGHTFSLKNISSKIDTHKKQIEILEEIRVAILRIKDEFGIEPTTITTETYKRYYEISYVF